VDAKGDFAVWDAASGESSSGGKRNEEEEEGGKERLGLGRALRKAVDRRLIERTCMDGPIGEESEKAVVDSDVSCGSGC